MKASERFQEVFGPDPRMSALISLRGDLEVAERERAAAALTVRQLHEQVQELAVENEHLRESSDEHERTVRTLKLSLGDTCLDRDHLRYLTMRRGDSDPLPGLAPNEHQGLWTPGRPYLGLSHCSHPETGECYRAQELGVAAGHPPRNTREWERCQPGANCPQPSARRGPPWRRPATSPGAIWRQSAYWWDRHRVRWSISKPGDEHGEPLSDEHLLGVIVWLHENLPTLWSVELRPVLVPCPPHAYTFAREWLADLPLMRALQDEKRRRGLRFAPGARPQANGGDARWA